MMVVNLFSSYSSSKGNLFCSLQLYLFMYLIVYYSIDLNKERKTGSFYRILPSIMTIKYQRTTCCTGDDWNKKSPPHELLLPWCETNSSSKETRDLRKLLLPQPTSPPHPLLLSQSSCTIACASSITHGLSSTAYKIL